MDSPNPSAISDPPAETTTTTAAEEHRPSGRRRHEPPDRPSGPPLFSRYDPEAPPAATPNLTTTPDDPGADSADFSAGAPEKGPQRGRRSDFRSTIRRRSSTQRKLKHAIAGGFTGASVRLNQMLARDRAELDYGVWIAEREDAYGVADPLSAVLARRAGPDVANPDVSDAIDALIALASFVSKALLRKFELRRAIAAGEIVVPPEPPAPGHEDAGGVEQPAPDHAVPSV